MLCILSPFLRASLSFGLLTECTLGIDFHKAYNIFETDESGTAYLPKYHLLNSLMWDWLPPSKE